MIAHASINVSDFSKSKKFYEKALKPLGYELYKAYPKWKVAGFGIKKKADFWIHVNPAKKGSHIAFVAKDKGMVNAFYKAAMAAGGKDNGKPEYQLDYGPGYYAAFVYDLDGNNIEAVFNDPSKK